MKNWSDRHISILVTPIFLANTAEVDEDDEDDDDEEVIFRQAMARYSLKDVMSVVIKTTAGMPAEIPNP
jgi:hypothetical protein